MAIWNNKNPACIATYNILESDSQLNQFDTMFLPFDAAGDIKLSSLPYYGKYGMSGYDLHGRAAQMARYFFKYLINHYTDRRHNTAFTAQQAWDAFQKLFESSTSTISDLASEADAILKFDGEQS